MAVEFKDYYKILGVDRKADAKTIKSAYRRLARKYHPDVAKSKDAPERFKEISEAYEVLSDPEKRQRYDSLGPDWQRYATGGPGPGPGGQRVEWSGDIGDAGDFSDFFRSIFSDLGARTGRGQRPGRGGGVRIEDLLGRGGAGARMSRGGDVQSDVEITLEEAYHGTRKTFALDLEEPCPTCQGAGNIGGRPCPTCHGNGWKRERREIDVKIPAGVRTGQRVRVSGEGSGVTGARGDLYLVVTVLPHPVFERNDDDLQVELPITPPEAVLGTTVEVPTLRGKVSMKIPAGTSSGRTFRLRGYGMPRPKAGGSGDQLVRVKIVVPPEASAAERELYTKLRAVESTNPRAHLR